MEQNSTTQNEKILSRSDWYVGCGIVPVCLFFVVMANYGMDRQLKEGLNFRFAKNETEETIALPPAESCLSLVKPHSHTLITYFYLPYNSNPGRCIDINCFRPTIKGGGQLKSHAFFLVQAPFTQKAMP